MKGYGELLTINPSYSLTYNETNYSNYVVKAATQCRAPIQYTKPLIIGLKNWVFVMILATFNSNIADGFKRIFIYGIVV
jgi:hypothetical protein